MKRFGLMCLCLTFGVVAAKAATPAEQLQKATNVMNEIMKTPDQGIPSNLLAKAVCVGIVPSELKFAIGVGGSYGRGVLVCRKGGDGPWGAPSMFTLGGGSFGFQLGGQATDGGLYRDERVGRQETGPRQREAGRGHFGRCGSGGTRRTSCD
jgi:lipid-binding SYLF domain-containing protein